MTHLDHAMPTEASSSDQADTHDIGATGVATEPAPSQSPATSPDARFQRGLGNQALLQRPEPWRPPGATDSVLQRGLGNQALLRRAGHEPEAEADGTSEPSQPSAGKAPEGARAEHSAEATPKPQEAAAKAQRQEPGKPVAPAGGAPAPAAAKAAGRPAEGIAAATGQIASGEPEGILEGLGGTPPSGAPEALALGRTASDEGFRREHATMAARPPSLERPTGLPRKGEAKVEPEPPAKGKKSPKPVQVPEGKQRELDPTHHVSSAPLPVPAALAERIDAAPEEGEQVAHAATAALSSVPTNDESIDTSAGPAPTVQLVDDLNPKQMNEQLAGKREVADEHWAEARTDIARDYGENDVWPQVPRETLRGKVPGGRRAAGKPAAVRPLAVGDEAMAALDRGAGTAWNEEIAKAKGENAKAREEREAGEAQERDGAKADIAALEQEAVARQTAARAKGKADVAQGRLSWTMPTRSSRPSQARRWPTPGGTSSPPSARATPMPSAN